MKRDARSTRLRKLRGYYLNLARQERTERPFVAATYANMARGNNWALIKRIKLLREVQP